MRDGSSTTPALRQALHRTMRAHIPRVVDLWSNVMRILRRLSVTSGMERSWCVTWMKTASVFTFIVFVQRTESVVRSMPSSKNWSAQRCKSPQGRHSARTALKRPCDGQEAAATCPGDTCSVRPTARTDGQKAKELSVDPSRQRMQEATMLEYPAHLSLLCKNTTIDHFAISSVECCTCSPVGNLCT